jgi:hypothetical protein
MQLAEGALGGEIRHREQHEAAFFYPAASLYLIPI